MEYHIIGGDTQEASYHFYTIQKLIDLAKEHKAKRFVFLGTEYAPKELSSWRGSYDLAAITYDTEIVTGNLLAKNLSRGLKEVHTAYKGGDYRYYPEDEFYIANYGSASEYKVVGHEVKNETVTLLTRIDRY